MSKSLDEAAAENARWEKQKHQLDDRLARLLTTPDKPVVPAPTFPAPLRDRVDNFSYNFRRAFENYITELHTAAGTANGSAKGELDSRANAIQSLLARFAGNYDEFFKLKGDDVFIKYLKQAVTPGNCYCSAKNAAMLTEARDTLTTLRVQYTVEMNGGRQ